MDRKARRRFRELEIRMERVLRENAQLREQLRDVEAAEHYRIALEQIAAGRGESAALAAQTLEEHGRSIHDGQTSSAD